MNIRSKVTVVAATLLLLSSAAQAQTVSVGSASGSPGGQATVQLNWDNNSNAYRSLQFDVNFDKGILPTVDTGTCPVEPYISGYLVSTCDQRAAPNDNQVRLGLLLIAGSIPAGNLGQLTFNIDAGASPGTTPLTITGVVIEGNPTPTINDGQITIVGPDYSSSPAAPGNLDFGSVQTGTTPNPTQNVTVTNVGGAGSLLNATCTSDNAAFIVSGGTITGLAQNASQAVGVACDASLSPNTYNGTLTCNHNGDGTTTADPATYTMACVVTPGPQPAYASDPGAGTPITMSAANVGDPIADQTITISNSGDNGTTLNVDCGFSGDSPPITLSGGGAFSVPKGSAHVLTLSCSSDAETSPTATGVVSCSSNNASNLSEPATYAVSCDVGPLKPAIFGSNPAAPDPIDLGDVIQGGPDPSAPLTISNDAAAPAQNLELVACSLTGDVGTISVSADLSSSSIAPGGSVDVSFACDTDAAIMSYSATYSCDYTVDNGAMPTGSAGGGTASWPVTCEVRDAAAEVSASPMPGETLSAEADPGGSVALDPVTFREINDEGAAGSLTGCSVDDPNFAVTSPASFPVDITAALPVQVVVTGTDPGGVDSISGTLTCTYTDTDNPEPVSVSWPLLVTFGGDATFMVTKTFTDGSPASVTVTISCDTGLPLEQSKVISQGNGVNFVVTSYESGAMNCSITESSSTGYTTTYTASGDSQNDNTGGCHFSAIGGGDANACAIENTPAPVTVSIRKEWMIDGTVADDFVPSFEVTLYCDSEIVGGTPDYPMMNGEASALSVPTSWYREFSGVGDTTFAAQVIPDYPSTHCWVEEDVDYSAVETLNGCSSFTVSAGGSHSCTITNTVFYEGIPTLSQWGLMILVLLTLGVGLVGVRRFS